MPIDAIRQELNRLDSLPTVGYSTEYLLHGHNAPDLGMAWYVRILVSAIACGDENRICIVCIYAVSVSVAAMIVLLQFIHIRTLFVLLLSSSSSPQKNHGFPSQIKC